MREIGIQPDILVCRTEKPLSEDIKEKISLFCNVPKGSVIEARDAETIYQIPLVFKDQGLDKIILNHFNLKSRSTDLKDWNEKVVQRVLNPKHKVTVAIVGKYIGLQDAYKSIYESLTHAGIYNNTKVASKNMPRLVTQNS